MNQLSAVGVFLLCGFVGGKLVNRVKLPAVTGYLLVGLAIGPSILGIVSEGLLTALAPISSLALGLIAFTIGGEFEVDHLAKLGKSVIAIAIFEVVGALTAVTLVFHLVLHQPLYVSLIFGAISSATAPAATIMVLREYRAKGPLTDTLLAVVAIDDALCVMAYGLAAAAARALTGKVGGGAADMFLAPVWEIGGSMVIGALAGIALAWVVRRLSSSQDTLVVSLGAVLLMVGIAPSVHLSPLLCGMAFGAALANASPAQARRVFSAVRNMDTPIYVAFFTLVGATLHLDLLPKVGVLGIAYVVARVIGKAAGAAFGAQISGAPSVVKRYLGLGLVPQAGVAIGVMMLVREQFAEIGPMVSTVVLGSVVIYELLGPLASKIAITLAGEVGREADGQAEGAVGGHKAHHRASAAPASAK